MARAKTVDETTGADEQRTVVYLGNRKSIAIQGDERVPYPGKRCTTVVLRPGLTLMEAAQDITGPNGVWQAHSDADAPAWVAAEGPDAEGLAELLSKHYRCELRDPEPAGENAAPQAEG